MTAELPIDEAMEKGYNLRALRGDLDDLLAGWAMRSEAFRSTADASLDLSYDDSETGRLDIFRSGEPGAPLYVFIHGGYWQRGDKSIYSFVAEPFLATGADVALIGYQLCPDASMTSMVAQHRKALAWLWQNGASHGVSPDHINISGHSAGGHLTAMMLTTDWPDLDPELPADLIKSGIPISGLYQLEPLRRTTIAAALNLDDAEAEALSPHLHAPATAAPVLVTLGGDETSEFHRQTNDFVAEWSNHPPRIAHHAEPSVDHFDVLNRLASPTSEIFQKARNWLL